VVIKFNFQALRQARWHEYALRFVLGGIITVLTGLIASKWGPVFGGLFLAFPAIFPASATLLEKHEREKKQKAGIAFTIRGRLAAALEARGAIMGAVGAAAFGVIVWKLLPSHSLGATVLIALLAWITVSAVIWYVQRHL
jgi:Protein of unknown function (DUF3147)